VDSPSQPPAELPAAGARRPAPAPAPGAMDTDAIRRSWPDVLTKIGTITRVTWSLVSENTRVLDYNGERLLLGLSTEGLLSAFRGRNHAEVVRQALSEVIGVDTRVEGVLSAEAEAEAAFVGPAVPAAETPGSARSGDPERIPEAAIPEPDPEPDDDWNTSTPPPDQPSAPPAPSLKGRPAVPDRPTMTVKAAPLDRAAVTVKAPAPDRPSTPRQRAKAAVAQEVRSRATRSSSSMADDSVVSRDDEDIEEAGAMGQPVIERVLGGIVIGELDQ
jgi:DNA polymerase-3 subunit gamma/tau